MSNLKDILSKIRASRDEEALAILKKAVDDEDMQGMSVVDDPDADLDDSGEAAAWLEQANKEKGRRQKVSDWKAPEGLSDEQMQAVQDYLDQGHSDREAHRFAGTHKEHKDIRDALKSSVMPSMMSDKHLETLGPLAKEWMDNADRVEKLSADVDKNPLKYASGQMMQAHEDATGSYNKAYHDFLNEMKEKHGDLKQKMSDLQGEDPDHPDLPGLQEEAKKYSGRGRHETIKQWKKDWKEQNPDYETGLSEASEKQGVAKEARETAAKNLQEKLDHIMRGGVAMPGVSTTEAAQHLGQDARGEGVAPQVSTEDNTPDFAAKNPQLIDALNQDKFKDHKERFDRINSHAQANKVIRRPKREE